MDPERDLGAFQSPQWTGSCGLVTSVSTCSSGNPRQPPLAGSPVTEGTIAGRRQNPCHACPDLGLGWNPVTHLLPTPSSSALTGVWPRPSSSSQIQCQQALRDRSRVVLVEGHGGRGKAPPLRECWLGPRSGNWPPMWSRC